MTVSAARTMELQRTVASLLLAIGVVTLATLSLSMGQVSLGLEGVISALADWSGDSVEARIVTDLRLPRILAAASGGAAIAVAGLLLQTLFRNPLADSWSLGLMAGGQLGAALVIVAGAIVGPAFLTIISALAGLGIVLGACAGMLGVAVAMASLARRVGTVTLLVVGLMLGFLSQGLTSVLLHFTNRAQGRVFSGWNDGNFAGVTWSELPLMLTAIALGLAMAAWISKPLTSLLLGETYATSLGTDVPRLRRTALGAAVLLAAPVTAYCGPIYFIGLIVPHVARSIARSGSVLPLLPLAALLGALLGLAGDFVIHLPWEQHFLHLNAVLALIGAPAVILLLTMSRAAKVSS